MRYLGEHVAQLRRNLDEAQAAYKRAKVEYQRLMAISKDACALKDSALADGNLELRQAMRVHFEARMKYQRALQEFMGFILNGKARR